MSRYSHQKKNIWLSLAGIIVLAVLILLCYTSCSKQMPVAQTETTAATEPSAEGPDETLNFHLYDSAPMPVPPEQGRGEPMEHLVPMYGADYENDPLFKETVTAFRRWQWNVVYRNLDDIVAADPENLDAYRFQAEVYLIGSKYKAALGQLDQILRRDPSDIHALGVSTILCRILEDKEGEKGRMETLMSVSPEAAEAVTMLLNDVETYWNAPYEELPQTDMVPDAIVTFGQTPKPNGTPSGGLLNRLNKTLEMAQLFPDAAIIVSGGDVKTEFTEASVMKNWLVEQGIAEDRIYMDELARDTYGNAVGSLLELEKLDAHKAVVVATRLHLPRATTTMALYAKRQGYELEVDSAGSGDTDVRDEGERLYTYIAGARAAGLFTKSDYQKFAG